MAANWMLNGYSTLRKTQYNDCLLVSLIVG